MEEMRAFFTARAEGYDQHMLEEVEGCSEGYSRMAQALPELLQDILESAGELSDRADCENLVTTAFAEAAIS